MDIDLDRLKRGEYEPECLRHEVHPGGREAALEGNELNRRGLLHKPVADDRFLEDGGERIPWPGGKTFAVCLTHDVDEVTQYSFKKAFRRRNRYPFEAVSIWPQVKNFFWMGMDFVKAAAYSMKKDPLHRYEEWLSVESEVGARSTFFFWAGVKNIKKRHHTDCRYDMKDSVVFGGKRCSVAEMIREIDTRGWEIGLHASWYSYDDVDEMKLQKESVEKIVGHEIVSVRQHYLHYDIRRTPAVQAAAGFKYDSTLGFSTDIGFRFGTSYPWMLYDLGADRTLDVMEIPLIVQEGAVIGKDGSVKEAFQRVVDIAEKVEAVGGVLTLLWHPNYMNCPGRWGLYLQVLKYLREKDPWFALLREAGGWRREHI